MTTFTFQYRYTVNSSHVITGIATSNNFGFPGPASPILITEGGSGKFELNEGLSVSPGPNTSSGIFPAAAQYVGTSGDGAFLSGGLFVSNTLHQVGEQLAFSSVTYDPNSPFIDS